MIVLLAKSVVLEGKQQEFIAAAEKLVKATREEPGCVYYDLVQDASDDRVFTFVEKYLDEAAVEAHTNSEHFQTYVPLMSAFREGPSEVTKCVTVDF
ncbi:MAG: antibiotic biosynthesis monooxygenase [Anaerotignum sp.]|nr:antibiotic biosynthesis monooxygenase [Anaerotignum sp.]